MTTNRKIGARSLVPFQSGLCIFIFGTTIKWAFDDLVGLFVFKPFQVCVLKRRRLHGRTHIAVTSRRRHKWLCSRLVRLFQGNTRICRLFFSKLKPIELDLLAKRCARAVPAGKKAVPNRILQGCIFFLALHVIQNHGVLLRLCAFCSSQVVSVHINTTVIDRCAVAHLHNWIASAVRSTRVRLTCAIQGLEVVDRNVTAPGFRLLLFVVVDV